MIATLSGVLVRIDGHKLLLQNPMIGFEVWCPAVDHQLIGSSIVLHTYMHWVQDQAPQLYGFFKQEEKEIFLLVISCSGIGPKLGLALLEQVDAYTLLHILAQEDSKRLSSLKHIGAKKAEQLCMQLKHKAAELSTKYAQAMPQGFESSAWKDLQDTLVSLHYSPAEIKKAVHMIRENIDSQDVSFDVLLRKALHVLSKRT